MTLDRREMGSSLIFSVETGFRRQNLMSKITMAVDPQPLGIRMKRKDLIKTFLMTSNCEKNFVLHGLYLNSSAL